MQQLEWKTFEHEHIHKTSDWFWALGIISVAGAVTSIIFSNILFAGVILIGAFVLGMHATKKPSLVHFRITNRGIIIDNIMHPYSSLESFWVEDEDEHKDPKLLVKSKKLLSPHIVIPIKHVSPDDVRDQLLEYIDEEEDSESLAQKIMESFGF
jgi:hypothetical protein